MKSLIAALYLGICSAGFSAAPLPAFNGVLTVSSEPRFVLVAPDGRTSPFLRLGERFAGYTLKSYDAAGQNLALERDGAISQIHLAADAAIKNKNDAAKVAASDRAVLEKMIAKMPVTGAIVIGGQTQMIMGKVRLPAGSKFTASYEGENYEVELAKVDRTTFTLRYHGIEITRPIKNLPPAANP